MTLDECSKPGCTEHGNLLRKREGGTVFNYCNEHDPLDDSEKQHVWSEYP